LNGVEHSLKRVTIPAMHHKDFAFSWIGFRLGGLCMDDIRGNGERPFMP
jgi:hypothetical protein